MRQPRPGSLTDPSRGDAQWMATDRTGTSAHTREGPGRWVDKADPSARTAPEPGVPLGPDAPILAVMSTTRAIRHLAPDAVPDRLLHSILEAATWAPSGGNWQPISYVLVTDRAAMARLALLWRGVVEDWRLLAAAAGIGDGRPDSARALRVANDYQRDHFEDTPSLIVVCDDSRIAGELPSRSAVLLELVRRAGLRRAIRIARGSTQLFGRGGGASIYPAVENLLLAARAQGLGACLTTWHLLAEDDFKNVLAIPRHVRTWAVVPIGWPLRPFGPVRRRPVDEVIHHDRW